MLTAVRLYGIFTNTNLFRIMKKDINFPIRFSCTKLKMDYKFNLISGS